MGEDCGFALRIPPACREVARNLDCVRFQTSAVSWVYPSLSGRMNAVNFACAAAAITF
jgi:hypothetical protein